MAGGRGELGPRPGHHRPSPWGSLPGLRVERVQGQLSFSLGHPILCSWRPCQGLSPGWLLAHPPASRQLPLWDPRQFCCELVAQFPLCTGATFVAISQVCGAVPGMGWLSHLSPCCFCWGAGSRVPLCPGLGCSQGLGTVVVALTWGQVTWV